MGEDFFDFDQEDFSAETDDKENGWFEDDPHIEDDAFSDDSWAFDFDEHNSSEEGFSDKEPNEITDNINSEHQTDETEGHPHTHYNKSNISFMGAGRCVCGCGSFVGSGNECQACHHSWDAHSRYKK